MTSFRSEHQWLGFAVIIIICFAVAGIGGIVTSRNIDAWYAALAKPAWTPPNWIFGPAWSILYLCMAIAAWLVWRQNGAAGSVNPAAQFIGPVVPMAIFAVQLALNAAWSWLFFGLQNPGLAFVEVICLWIAIAATIIVFWGWSAAAGLLLVPYICWVTFASILNYAIWRMNA